MCDYESLCVCVSACLRILWVDYGLEDHSIDAVEARSVSNDFARKEAARKPNTTVLHEIESIIGNSRKNQAKLRPSFMRKQCWHPFRKLILNVAVGYQTLSHRTRWLNCCVASLGSKIASASLGIISCQHAYK